MEQKVVFFQGTFDLLNVGHIRACKLAKSYGDILVVGLNSDELIRWFKKREPIMPLKQRKELVEAIKYVDRVIVCHEPAAIRYLKKLNASVYVLTKEWMANQREAIEWIWAKGGKVVFSPRWKDIFCSTDLRNRVLQGG